MTGIWKPAIPGCGNIWSLSVSAPPAFFPSPRCTGEWACSPSAFPGRKHTQRTKCSFFPWWPIISHWQSTMHGTWKRRGTFKSKLENKNDRLELVLELTNRVVSNLELRDLLREVSGSVRRVMKCDAAGVALPERKATSASMRLDFPGQQRLPDRGDASFDELAHRRCLPHRQSGS